MKTDAKKILHPFIFSGQRRLDLLPASAQFAGVL